MRCTIRPTKPTYGMKNVLAVRCDTFWDKFEYSLDTDNFRVLYPFKKPKPLEESAYEEVEETELLPGLYYRQFLRKIQVDVIDLRTGDYLEATPAWSPRIPETPTRRLLMPLVHRMESVFSAPGNLLKIDIRVVTLLARWNYKDIGYDRIEETLGWEVLYNKICNAAYGRLKNPTENRYRQLITTVWPFTQGPWQYSIKTPLDEVFGNFKADQLQICTNLMKSPEKEMSFKTMELCEDCIWVQNKGRLAVKWKPRYGQWRKRAAANASQN
ncbi:hypothetical protein TWF694_001310 [Orbilia ellipsospora]|uniref:Uncharacterized protein n=1 Tax=Orbilia ellipsospora TaxID=2528407 RepID=A0AAV9XRP0_9PEZI